MEPGQLAALSTLVAIAERLSSWPFGMIMFAIVIGPWVLSLLLAQNQRKRFEEVVSMYESNVRLVEKYETAAGDLKEVVIMNTQAMTKLNEGIEKNQFCPMVREVRKKA